MTASDNRIVVVTGATGLQGGAVARCLLQDGWHVRALTRNAGSSSAKSLASLGAEVMQGDMDSPATLAPVFDGAVGVYSVQNNMISGLEGEIRQGKNVADAARQAGMRHIVYGSAGTEPYRTGVGSWDAKVEVEEYINSLGLPLTVLRPTAFMELMTHKKFYPAASTWHLMPALMGSTRKVAWLSAADLGAIAAKVFASPDAFIGKTLTLASDVQSIDECRALYREVMGKKPPHFPMPIWLFKRFVGDDLITMWRWLGVNDINLDTTTTKTLHPGALSVKEWLSQQRTV
jgi:uncharacterized protein YbjT (DUF2867 family)